MAIAELPGGEEGVAEVWSDQEIDHIVADYFAMLTDELVGRSFNKAARNRDLQAVIDRSKGSIEFKNQNISAVLLGLGQPWIEGYKPAANFQKAQIGRASSRERGCQEG